MMSTNLTPIKYIFDTLSTFFTFSFPGWTCQYFKQINFINKLIECTPGLSLERSLVTSVNMTLLKYSFWHSFLSFLYFHFLGRPVDTLSGLTFVNQIIHKIWRLREDKFLRMPVLRNFARTNLRQWSFWKISRG